MPIRRVTFRVVRVVLAVACLAGVLLAPAAAHAGPDPAWKSRDLPGLDLGLPSTHVPNVVLHRGEIYAALRAHDNAIVVRRWDRALDAWLPVGGPIAHTLNARATQPRLVSEHDELYLTYTELDAHDRPNVIVARLTERGPRSSWQIAQPLAGGTASLVHVGHGVWAVWRGRDGVIHLARLDDGGHWDVSKTTLTAPALSLSILQALEFQGAIYVLYRVDHAWRPGVGGHPLQRPPDTRAAFVERVDVTRDPDAPSDLLTTLAIPGRGIVTANLTPVAGGRPLLTWGYTNPSRGRFVQLRFEELSIDARRFLPIGQALCAASDVAPFVFAASPQEILLISGGLVRSDGTYSASFSLLQRESMQNEDGTMLDELVMRRDRIAELELRALLLPRGEVLTVVLSRGHVRAELHTPRAIAPPDPAQER